MRFSMPVLTTRRGAGLGNEVISWGKALIGAQELGLVPLHPPWGLNARGYWRDFGTSRLDWVQHAALRALPHLDIGRVDDDDYGEAMLGWQEAVRARRGPLVVRHRSGMSGGYLAIRRARPLLIAALTAPGHVGPDLYQLGRRLNPGRLTVALHVRVGDFDEAAPEPGTFNRRLPLDWYVLVAQQLTAHFSDRLQLLVFSDDPGCAASFEKRGLSITPLPDRRSPMLSDLLAMAGADLLVCSISSFAMLAAFLSGSPYIWYGPHLVEREGWRSIWGHEPDDEGGGVTARNAAEPPPNTPIIGRGTAIDVDGLIPDELIVTLERTLEMKCLRHDLLMGGVVPALPTGSSQ